MRRTVLLVILLLPSTLSNALAHVSIAAQIDPPMPGKEESAIDALTTYSPTNPDEVSVLIPMQDIEQIVTGSDHTCALTTAGGVKCWGVNGDGQLGIGTFTHQSTPTDVVGLSSGVAAIAGGWKHTCALMQTGGVKCWGDNEYGQLGDGSSSDKLTPTHVSGLSSGAAVISAGRSHTCALTTSGGVKCWGNNGDGQLGIGTTTIHLTPISVTGLNSGVADVSTGRGHTCALMTTGGVKCWGDNEYGQLGDGSKVNRLTPTNVVGLGSSMATINAGNYYTCALTTAGGAKCWGDNNFSQLGDGSSVTKTTPVNVVGLSSGVVSIGSGRRHNCATTASGAAKCWGDNEYGQLGDGSAVSRLTPTNVVGLNSGIAAISAGRTHTCALTTAGQGKCWGNNQYGQLGDGSTIASSTPVDVKTDQCYRLALTHSGSGNDPAGDPQRAITCPTDYYIDGTKVTLTAAPTTGWAVAYWSGTDNDASTSLTNVLTMPASNHSVGVTYESISATCYNLTLFHNGNGIDPIASPSRSDECENGHYIGGASIALSSQPDSGWQVAAWQGTNNDAGTSLTNVLTMPASNHSVGVTYERQTTQPPTTTNYYLPAISRNPFVTPTPVIFPQLINGNFDAPGDTSWQQASLGGLALIVSEDFIDDQLEVPIRAVSPPNLAWLGGRANERSRLWQEVQLPVALEEIRLRFSYRIASEENTCGDDRAYININSRNIYDIDLCKQNNTSEWNFTSIDLSDFIGENVTITFLTELDSDDQISNWFLDNISLCDGSPEHPCD
ncbi:MAG: hypothetical protein KDD92_20225 [Caldilineaceae bacterium]|nr:hypothetical protein [Caldilineaceae bacterium]